MAHSPFAPSAAHRWMACPGSVAFCKDAPDTAGPEAAFGTYAHAVAAHALPRGLSAADAIRHVDRPEGVPELTDTDEAALDVYLDGVRAVMFTDGARLQELRVEHKVQFGGVTMPRVFGTADALVLAVATRTLHVFDLKFGQGVFVDADAAQLRIYALGALVEFAGLGFDAIALHVVQPRCAQGRPWRTVTIPRADLLAWAENVLVPAVKAAQAPDAPLVATDEGCRWCPRKTECPKLREHLHEVAVRLFDDPVAETPVPKAPDVAGLSPADMGKLLGLFDRVEDYIKAVRARAFDAARNGHHVPGWKLVAKRGLRRWKDETAAVFALREAGIGAHEAPKVISPAKAEKALGKARAKDIVTPLVEVPTTGVSLVPESDDRPAISPSDAFTDLTELTEP